MKYELTFLLNEESELKKLKELLKTLDIKLLAEESWGKKTLAYAIKKQLTATYYNWKLDIKRTQIAELKKRLNYNEVLIRYLLLAVEE